MSRGHVAIARPLNWLRPMRSFSVLASGGFLFMFLLTAVGRSGSGLGGGSPSSFITAPEYVAPPRAAAASDRDAASVPSPLGEPTTWLGLSGGAAVIAVVAHRRLRHAEGRSRGARDRPT